MSSEPSEIGGDLQKQFKKAVVSGGPLRGARYLDVGWEDLKKAARSYRTDARFNQFAKRGISERALSQQAPQGAAETPETSATTTLMSAWVRTSLTWLGNRIRGRMLLTLSVLILVIVLVSRPLFYVVLARTLTLCIKLTLRRSFLISGRVA